MKVKKALAELSEWKKEGRIIFDNNRFLSYLSQIHEEFNECKEMFKWSGTIYNENSNKIELCENFSFEKAEFPYNNFTYHSDGN